MRPLRATECISPAIDLPELIRFSPFRKGRSWKLCATAYLTRFGTMYLPWPLLPLAAVPFMHAAGPILTAILCVSSLVLFAVFTWIFHLCSRLQFAWFDMVVNRGEFVAPAWRKYHAQTLRWSGFKILIGFAVSAVCAVPIAALAQHMVPFFVAATRHGNISDEHTQLLMAAFNTAYLGFLLCTYLYLLATGLLADFIVPSLALEDTGIKEGFRRMGELIRREPGEFALYVLLKVALGSAAYICAIIGFEIAMVLVSLVAGLVVVLIGFAFHFAGLPSALLAAAVIIFGIAWFTVLFGYGMFIAVGPVLTWMDAYALYFLGGRYPMLGELLERSTQAPVIVPGVPTAPVPAYPPPSAAPEAPGT